MQHFTFSVKLLPHRHMLQLSDAVLGRCVPLNGSPRAMPTACTFSFPVEQAPSHPLEN